MTEFVWGIDVSTTRLAFAFASLDTTAVKVETLITRTEEREGARLGLLDRQLRIFGRLRGAMYPPACVWVEQASGRFQAPQLLYAIGVIQAALAETLPCPVWTVPSSAWKKRSVGRGNASKEQIAAWAESSGYEFEGQDEADAIGIAVAGRAMFTTGRWEAAA